MGTTGGKHHFAVILAALTGLCAVARCGLAAAESRPQSTQSDRTQHRIPIIYGTDLFHPHDDPDDHFDLATLFSMPEFDVKAILLDLGKRQKEKPGRIPVEQMFRLTGRRAPYATGLNEKLKSPGDKALDQPKEDHAAVELLLKTLQETPQPLVVFLTGSVRDICAAFNRKPDLLRKKIARLYINIGNLLQDKGEWNESLDPQAYIGIMRSGLPIYWCPCGPVKMNRSTHWAFRQGHVLEGVPPALLNWFIYALQVPRPDELDPIAALTMDLRPWRHLVMDMKRSMWCTGPMIHAAGRTMYRIGDNWVAADSAPDGATPSPVFAFVPVRVEIRDIEGRAYTKWGDQAANPNMHVYKVTDPKNHEPALTSCLRDLLHHFPAILSPTTKP